MNADFVADYLADYKYLFYFFISLFMASICFVFRFITILSLLFIFYNNFVIFRCFFMTYIHFLPTVRSNQFTHLFQYFPSQNLQLF